MVILSVFAIGNSNAQTTVLTNTYNYTFDIRCDGVVTDEIQGTITQHLLIHRDKSGNIIWVKQQMDGDNLESSWNDETFKMKRITRQDGPYPTGIMEATYHYNFIGDKGSHYFFMRTLQIDYTVNPPVLTNISETSKCW